MIEDEFMMEDHGLASCHCPQPCVDTDYMVQLSTHRFPSTGYMTLISDHPEGTLK